MNKKAVDKASQGISALLVVILVVFLLGILLRAVEWTLQVFQ